MKKLLFIVFALGFILFSSNIPKAHAQYYSPYSIPTSPGVQQNLKTYSHDLFLNALSEVTCILGGIDFTSPDGQCLGWDSKTQSIGYDNSHNGGLLGFMTHTIVLTYNIPIHTNSYINYVAQKFHAVSDKSYAANVNEIGVGAQGLDPLLSIWIGFRNSAYLFVVIVFIVLGLLIMFRVKIDPRTVMSIQNQLPKIIIGLLAITFSFAIAGFLIDMMYVLTYLFISIIHGSVSNSVFNLSADTLTSFTDPFSAADKLLPGGMGGVASTTANVLHNAVGSIMSNAGVLGGIVNVITLVFTTIPNVILGIICWVGSWNQNSAGCAGTDWQNTFFYAGGGTVIFIIYIALFVAILTALFRFWMALVTCYITILLNVILGPFRILFGMLPGGPGGGLTGWLKEIIANLIVFPVSLSFLILISIIAKAMGNPLAFAPFLVPGSNIGSSGSLGSNLLASSNPQLFAPYFVPGSGLGSIIGMASILMLPKLPETVKEWFKVKDGAMGSAVGQSIGAGFAFASGAVKKTSGKIGETVWRQPDKYRGIQAGIGWRAFNPARQVHVGQNVSSAWKNARGPLKPLAAGGSLIKNSALWLSSGIGKIGIASAGFSGPSTFAEQDKQARSGGVAGYDGGHKT